MLGTLGDSFAGTCLAQAREDGDRAGGARILAVGGGR